MLTPEDAVKKALARHPILWMIPDIDAAGVQILASQLAEAAIAALPQRRICQPKLDTRVDTEKRRKMIMALRAEGKGNRDIEMQTGIPWREIYRAAGA